jgi:hypothetical protein
MKYLKTILLSSFLLSLTSHIGAQNTTFSMDTLWYLNGDSELISDYQFIEEGLILNYKNKKGKHRDVETFYLFSINKSDGSREILYKPNMGEEGDTLTLSEMESFVIGGFYGSTKYKAPWATAEGFVVGAASPFVVALAGLNPFFSIIIPAANTTVVGITKPCEKKIKTKYPELSKDQLFIEGYKEAAKRKRTKNSIKGGVVGLVVGIASVFIIMSNQ